MTGHRTFRELIAGNKRNSVVLMVVMFVFFIAIGGVLGGAFLSGPGSVEDGVVMGLVSGSVAAVVFWLFGWFGGEGALMAFHGAHEIEKSEAPQLFNIVEEMSIAAGIPMPRVYVMATAAPNAFATGNSPENAAVAVTTGLLEKLNRDELQGVIAHEMSHIRNYDIRYSMLMAVLAGGIVMLSEIFIRIGFLRSGRRSNDRGNAQAALVIIGVVLAVLAPLFTTLIQMAMSRQREYLADASAVELTRNPDGLAAALAKLGGDKTPMECSKATEAMFIVSPALKLRGGADSWFSTHPPIEERIRRLRALR